MSRQQWRTLIASDTASVEKVKGSRENEAQSRAGLQSKHTPTTAAENLQAENRSSDSGEYEKNQGGRLFLSALLTPLSSSLPPHPTPLSTGSTLLLPMAWSDVLLMMRISNV